MLVSMLLWTLALLLVAVGVAGTVMPWLPGTVLVLAASMDGFSRVGAGSVAVLVGLALLAFAADFITGALGAKRSGGSRRLYRKSAWAKLAATLTNGVQRESLVKSW